MTVEVEGFGTTIRGMDAQTVRLSRSLRFPYAVEVQAGCSWATLNPKGVKQLIAALQSALAMMESEAAREA